MNFIYILIPIIIIAIIVFVTLTIKRKINAKKEILEELNKLGKTKEIKGKVYDYEVDTKECIYLIKVIYNFQKLEISINNKNYWQLNDTVVASKKSGTKIEGIYDLINNDTFSFNKPHKKVYVVYPSSRVLVKAVNESELTFITPEMDCYGVNVVKFDEIKEIFKK